MTEKRVEAKEEGVMGDLDPSLARRPWMELDGHGEPSTAPFFEPERRERGDGAGFIPSLSPSRRGFLKALGLGAAGLAGCQRLPVNKAIPYLVPPEAITPGIPTYYASICGVCPARCGIMVKVLDGRPVKIEGNPEHPTSRGGLCAIGQGQLRELFDPGRLMRPLVGGNDATWDELDDFVGQRLEQLDAGGRPVYVVTRTITSPTARSAVEAFLAPFGGILVEHDLDPNLPSALLEAYETLDGLPLAPRLDLLSSDVLVSFAADPFGVGPDPVGNTRAWSARQRAAEEVGGRATRHIQIEASLTLSGAHADERWQATATQRQDMALWLLRSVAESSTHVAAAGVAGALAAFAGEPADVDRMRALSDDLVAAAGHSLVISGSNAPTEQLSVALINRLLGNEGRTLHLAPRPGAGGGLDRDLLEFKDDLLEGRVGAAVFVDLDVVGRLPDGDQVAEAIRQLPLSVGVFRRPNGTSAACGAVAPAHHPLESWSDAYLEGDKRALAQPVVRPLFDTRTQWRNFSAWSGSVATWRATLRGQWRALMQPGDPAFQVAWVEAVRTAGLDTSFGPAPDDPAVALADDALPPPVPAATSPAPQAAELLAVAARVESSMPDGQLQIEISAGVGQRYGDRAHNPWLRELPDPLTRVSWTPCARLGPARARDLGVTDGDVVRLSIGERSLRLPVRVLPGQHGDVVGVPVGLPQLERGDDFQAGAAPIDVADVGAPLLQYAPRPTGGSGLVWSGAPAQIEVTGEHIELPIVQPHALTEGRPIIHQVSRADEAVHGAHHVDASIWPAREPNTPHWEMVIDLNACVGCSGCVVACQVENNIAVVGAEQMAVHHDMHWLRIDRYFVGDPDSPDVLFEPMFCPQCDNAPCETVCPVAATVHSEDGLNQQVYNRCVGTRYCANNCPYKVRRFNWFNFQPTDPIERMALNPDVVVRARGVMEKCTFCVQRIQSARIEARRDGVPNLEVTTACEQSCPAQAIYFGDATDPDADITRLKQKGRAFQVLAELGVEPSVTYLAKVRNRDGAGSADTDDHGAGAGR